VFTAEPIAVQSCPDRPKRYLKKRRDEWETLARCVERAAE
jgi:hypothetical protein